MKNNIANLRKSKKLTQKDLAEKINLSREKINSYENDICRINDDVLIKLSDFFNVSIDYILNNDIKGKVIYSEEQKNAITDLCELNDDYLELASKYIKNLLADQVELENKRKLFN